MSAGQTAWLFPGQGSQKVGMGLTLIDAHPIAKQTFEEADDLLGISLSELMFHGPKEELDDTITAFKEIATILIDLNQNGTIEKEEIVQLLKDVATLIKDEISAQVCPEIIERAEKAGRWLKFRPVLNALYKQCT